MVEGHVPQGVEVQVLSSAHVTRKIPREGIFLFWLVSAWNEKLIAPSLNLFPFNDL